MLKKIDYLSYTITTMRSNRALLLTYLIPICLIFAYSLFTNPANVQSVIAFIPYIFLVASANIFKEQNTGELKSPLFCMGGIKQYFKTKILTYSIFTVIYSIILASTISILVGISSEFLYVLIDKIIVGLYFYTISVYLGYFISNSNNAWFVGLVNIGSLIIFSKWNLFAYFNNSDSFINQAIYKTLLPTKLGSISNFNQYLGIIFIASVIIWIINGKLKIKQ